MKEIKEMMGYKKKEEEEYDVGMMGITKNNKLVVWKWNIQP